MSNDNKTNKAIIATEEAIRQGYEQSVLQRMKGRAGSGSLKGNKGNVLEILATDKINAENILNPDIHAKLTKNSTATQVDAVVMNGNKVAERIQYKDTAKSIDTTIKQVKSGKYNQTQMHGTTEAAEAFNNKAAKAGLNKTMKDTGISTVDTERLGKKYLHKAPSAKGLASVATKAGATAGVLTAVVETGKAIKEGESASEASNHIVAKSSEAAMATAGGVALAETVIPMLPTAITNPPLATAAIGAGIAFVGGEVVSKVVKPVCETLGDAAEVITETAVEIGEMTIDEVETQVTKQLEIAMDKTDDFFTKANDKIDETFVHVKNTAFNVDMGIRDTVDFVKDTKEEIHQEIESIKEEFGGMGQDLAESAIEAGKEVLEETVDAIKSLFGWW